MARTPSPSVLAARRIEGPVHAQLSRASALAVLAGLIWPVQAAAIAWAVMKDRKAGGDARGPMATRTLNAGFSSAGMVNLAMVVIFGVGAWRDQDFAVWLYYPAVVFGLQAKLTLLSSGSALI